MIAALGNIICKTATYTGLSALRSALTAHKPRILMYHSIADTPGILPDALNVTPAVFDEQLRSLTAHHTIVPLQRIVDHIRDGTPIPPRAIALTFDDGLLNNLTIAAPLLAKHGATATFYVIGQSLNHKPLWLHRWYALHHPAENKHALSALSTHLNIPITTVREGVQRLKYHCPADKRDDALDVVERICGKTFDPTLVPLMTPAHLKKLASAGHTIGYHTFSHTPVAGLNPAQAKHELVASKQEAEQHIGVTLDHFAFPFGEPSSLGGHETLKKHYRSAVTTHEAFVTTDADVHALPRLSVINASLSVFKATLAGVRAAMANTFQRLTRSRP